MEILLGLNHLDLMLPRKIREGMGPEQPCAINTKVDWLVRGVLNNGTKNRQARLNLVQQCERLGLRMSHRH